MDPGAHSPDVAICGGGLVGATLALALAELGLDVVLIEAHPFGTFGQPSFDDRTTALSNGSRRIFEALKMRRLPLDSAVVRSSKLGCPNVPNGWASIRTTSRPSSASA